MSADPAAGGRVPHVDKADLQGNILCGYGTRFAHFAFLRASDGATARHWLAELLDRGVTTAERWPELEHGARRRPPHTRNVMFTFDGLRALDVPRELLATFPEEFREGMGARADLLGDTGTSAPGSWQPGIRPGEAHALVVVTSDDEDELRAGYEDLTRAVERARSGLTLVHEQRAGLIKLPEDAARDFAREHFGFADGLAQPEIDGDQGPWKRRGKGTPASDGRWRPLPPGEFVLGYTDADDQIADAPAEPLRRSGSFAVVRKLHQDVALFTRYLRALADGDPSRQELISAKVVGRWPDGTPVESSPESPDPSLDPKSDQFTDFRYGDDARGMRCPLGAHVRRANPRDALDPEGQLTRRHRIIRRGMPYGDPPADRAVDDGKDRGLMFVCYQASIGRQFEVIQGSWLNDGDAFGLGGDKDMLIGGDAPATKMVIQGDPPQILSAQPRFVTTRGGGYFFAPGVGALRALAEGI